MTKLIIVESPTKAKSITKYLANKYKVIASMGHVRDLPKSTMGVDVEHDFKPKYVIMPSKRPLIKKIKEAARNAEVVYLAPDPDREGEAIAWHIKELIKKENSNIKRVLFNEITPKGVKSGLEHTRDVDRALFESQQARRIMDRLVGYELSPLLWKKVRRGLSAGRVQSVAVLIIVNREEEIEAFVPEEYWKIFVELKDFDTPEGTLFKAALIKQNNKKISIPDKETADAVIKELEEGGYKVVSVKRTLKKRNPPPPFITSTLQQDAARRYRFPAKKTMSIAQKLYEGIEIGQEMKGLITYMRTDSTRVSSDAVNDVRNFINQTFNSSYLPEKPRFFKAKKNAQDAHEAIRPTDVSVTPEKFSEMLKKSSINSAMAANLLKLYSIIWKRFVASQMASVEYDATQADIQRGSLLLRSEGSVLKFKGYLAVYEEAVEGSKDTSKNKDVLLPPLSEGMTVYKQKVHAEQKFTQPPPRFTEATLIKELEDKGIGRPSTYATIISTILDREYVKRDSGKFIPTELGKVVTKLLVEAFPEVLNVEFTAQLEKKLDEVEENKVDWKSLLREFYSKFHTLLKTAEEKMPNLKTSAEPTDIVCDRCGAQMVIKWGSKGSFLACSNYPDCKNTREYVKTDDGKIEVVKPVLREEKCPVCGAPMVVKHGKYGDFLGCSNYPECNGTMPLLLPYSCPEEGCKGKLIKRKSKRGKVFYGCSEYPKCKYMTWDTPTDTKCPQCGWEYLFEKSSRKKSDKTLFCPKCDYSQKS